MNYLKETIDLFSLSPSKLSELFGISYSDMSDMLDEEVEITKEIILKCKILREFFLNLIDTQRVNKRKYDVIDQIDVINRKINNVEDKLNIIEENIKNLKRVCYLVEHNISPNLQLLIKCHAAEHPLISKN